MDKISRLVCRFGLLALLTACAGQQDPAEVSYFGLGKFFAPGQNTASAAAPSTPPGEIRVQPGNTLYGLAREHKIAVSELMRINNIADADTLYVGQVLKLRQAPAATTELAKAEPKQEAAPGAPLQLSSLPEIPLSQTQARAEPDHKEHDSGEDALARFALLKTPPTPARKPGVSLSRQGFIRPVEGRTLSSFGKKAGGKANDGITIGAPAGEPVFATADGEVLYVGNELKGYGNLIILRHESHYLSAYAHLAEMRVHRGQSVKQGQVVGTVGSSGGVAEPQLHFSIRKGKEKIDPATLLNSAVAARN